MERKLGAIFRQVYSSMTINEVRIGLGVAVLCAAHQRLVTAHKHPDLPSDNTRPPLLPPVMREKALRFQVRIHAMPFVGGQPLPHRLLTCPALTAHGLGGPRSVWCRMTTIGRWVPLSRFCTGPEGAASVRVGVVPEP